MQEQLTDEPLQGGEAAGAVAGPYGQRARVTPERLAFVIKEQWKTFNQVKGGRGGEVRREGSLPSSLQTAAPAMALVVVMVVVVCRGPQVNGFGSG